MRRLSDRDAAALWNFRLHALESAPAAFAESADEHRETSPEQYAERLRSGGNDNVVLGAFDQGNLIGMIGLRREHQRKRHHKAWIWGMFVAESSRRTGAGRALLEEAVRAARNLPGIRCVHLSVTETQATARGLYLSAGFRPYGLEPQALRAGDRYLDEEHMILEL